jgi:hypothetical protein
MDQYADVVLTIEERCWRMVTPDGPAKMRHQRTVLSRSPGLAGTSGETGHG